MNTSTATPFSIPFLRKGKVMMVQSSLIVRLEAQSNYTCIYFTDRPPVIMARVLKLYDEMLKPHGFIRIHRTHLINPQYVQDLDRPGKVQMIDQSLADISRRKRREVIRYFSHPLTGS
jgi:two-component system LytT family response regulator